MRSCLHLAQGDNGGGGAISNRATYYGNETKFTMVNFVSARALWAGTMELHNCVFEENESVCPRAALVGCHSPPGCWPIQDPIMLGPSAFAMHRS